MVDFHDKYSDRYIRENPTNPDEEQLAEQLAEQEIKGFMERLKGQKNFTRRVFQKLGPKLLETLQEQEKQVQSFVSSLQDAAKKDSLV